jgi:DNA-binding transcriptional MerR regulator
VSAARPSADDRVSAFPDERTIRYYRSLDLLDRPLRQRGRDGVYGYRHLLQAVTVKLLQAEGRSLAQIQRALTGLSTGRLEALVADALALGPRVPDPAPADPALPVSAPPLRRLLTAEVAPGVLVTVDAGLVADPDALLARIVETVGAG